MTKTAKCIIIIDMRIGNELPSIYLQYPMVTPQQNLAPPLGREQANNQGGPGVIVDISPAGWAASAQADGQKTAEALDSMECETCNSRRYQDVSNDSSVSFQAPTRIGPHEAAAAVAAHEAEHVANEQIYAERDGREIVSQTVRLHTAICPECNIIYVSGGETRTLSKPKSDGDAAGNAMMPNDEIS